MKGKEISKFLKADKFSRHELVDGRDGLLYFIDLLDSDKNAWMEWITQDYEIKRVKNEAKIVSKNAWFELIQFVTIQGFTNFVRLNEPKFFKTEQAILKKAKMLLPPEHFKFLKDVIEMKSSLREEGKIEFDTKKIKDKSRSFIEYLIRQAK